MKTITAQELLNELRADAAKIGSQKAYAALHKVNDTHVSATLNGRLDPSKAILDAMGYERVVLYRRKAKS